MRRVLLSLLLLAACSKGHQADLPSIGESRSLSAEWALVNEQAERGQVNRTYADTMRKELRQQLQTAVKGLEVPDSRYGQEMRALLAQPDDASPEVLRAHAAALKQIEDSLESA